MDRYELANKLELNLVEKRLGYHLTNNPNRLMPAGIKSVTVHQTDNAGVGADAENHHTYLANNSRGVKTSWHYTVDERMALQSFRDQRALWHSGRAEGNDSSIGIELCMDADKAGDPMMGEANYRKTLDNGAKLVALLLVEHGLTLNDVKTHNDWSGKNCPSQIRAKKYGISWADFMAQVEGYYKLLTAPAPVPDQLAPEGKLWSVRLWSGKSKSTAEAQLKLALDAGLKYSYLILMDDPQANK